MNYAAFSILYLLKSFTVVKNLLLLVFADVSNDYNHSKIASAKIYISKLSNSSKWYKILPVILCFDKNINLSVFVSCY